MDDGASGLVGEDAVEELEKVWAGSPRGVAFDLGSACAGHSLLEGAPFSTAGSQRHRKVAVAALTVFTVAAFIAVLTFSPSGNVIVGPRVPPLLGAWEAAGTQSCAVLREYPHDRASFTEGLEMVDDDAGVLVESTGRSSSLQWRQLPEGNLLVSRPLPNMFGEGTTKLGSRIYQLTWKDDVFLIYNASSRELLESRKNVIKQFESHEGWGITNDGRNLIASDGTNHLYLLDPTSFDVFDKVTVTDQHGQPVSKINELEYADGQVFFNVWFTNYIGVYDLVARRLVRWIDCGNLMTKERGHNSDFNAVLNGIAFLRTRSAGRDARRMLVTGKFWDRLYEVDYEVQP